MNALVNGSNQEIQKSFSEKANSTVIGGGDEGSSNFDLYKGKKRNHFLEKSGRSHVMNDVKLSRKRKKKLVPLLNVAIEVEMSLYHCLHNVINRGRKHTWERYLWGEGEKSLF